MHYTVLYPGESYMARVLLPFTMLLASASVASAQAAPGQARTPTLKAEARIVVIDVVVTDKQGKTVKNLQASDFALTENGAAQTINHFETHTSLSADDAAKVAEMPKLEPNIFTNYSPVPVNGSLNVLLLDEFDTKMTDKTVLLKQVVKYLATPHPGARMELFELTTDLRLLQGFTSDPEVLRAALTNRKAAPHTSAAVDGSTGCTMGEGPPGETTAWKRTIPLSVDGENVNPNLAQESAVRDCLEDRLEIRSLSTLKAMEALARYMGGLPGRKNLLWFSSSFWLQTNKRNVADELHKVMALFAKNQVAVYPIGARGLALAGPQGLDKVDAEKLTMDMMAEDTGGKVFTGSNDIAGEAEKAVDDGSNYYTLTYSPANHDWKGEFRKVEVKLAQKGYALAYRPGYYAEDADKVERKGAPAEAMAGAAVAPPDPARVALHAAMEYGSPQPADIVLKVAVNPATGQPENVVAKANNMAPKVSGPFERYVISVAALPQAFTFTRDTPGKIHMSARLVTRVYSADGALINSTTVNAIGDIDDARYQSIMADGMQFRQEVSVPVKGESFLRIGVEDLATNRVGVVEIPIATVAKLKPLGAATPDTPQKQR